jgi:hypothetical protein
VVRVGLEPATQGFRSVEHVHRVTRLALHLPVISAVVVAVLPSGSLTGVWAAQLIWAAALGGLPPVR